MNPFDLRGPEFLILYLVFGTIVILVMHWLIRSGEPRDMGHEWYLDDPYEIAYLRAGAGEALRVATMALMDRGLVKASGDKIVAAPDATGFVQRPIEHEIIKFLERPRDSAELFPALEQGVASRQYQERLADRGLMLGSDARMRRGMIMLGALVVLGGVATAKILIALGRGRHNVLFLFLLGILFMIVAVVSSRERRTAAGNSLVGTLRQRFASLKARAQQLKPGGATNELSFLLAAYGLSVLPASDFPFARKLAPKGSSSDGRGFGGGCGSSGCGGGGCGGGGCGGCGGG